MWKNLIVRFLNGFCYSIAIYTFVMMVVRLLTGHNGMLPEYAAGFEDIMVAYLVQQIWIGFISGVASAGTAIFELKRPGLLVQSILYLLLLLGTWIPVSCYLWGFHKYLPSMVSSLCSIFGTYSICWLISYKVCRRDVQEINACLNQKKDM